MKTGKRKLKAVARAIRNASKSPHVASQGASPFGNVPNFRAPVYDYINGSNTQIRDLQSASPGDLEHGRLQSCEAETAGGNGTTPQSSAIPIPEQQPLQEDGDFMRRDRRVMTRYGSIIGSPPNMSPELERINTQASSLRLPGPAMDSHGLTQVSSEERNMPTRPRVPASASTPRPTTSSVGHNLFASRHHSMFQPTRVNSMPGPDLGDSNRPKASRTFTWRTGRTWQNDNKNNIALNAYRDVDEKQQEFFDFLDLEMQKIEDFYRAKEEEATSRLEALRQQLHIMRDKRLEEVTHANTMKQKLRLPTAERPALASADSSKQHEGAPLLSSDKPRSLSLPWLRDVGLALDKAKKPHVGKTFAAMQSLGTPPGPSALDARRDYTRRPTSHDVSYRTAKHKLKIAMAEFYRGLELLKSYALLNRTGFRKINKKFDKTINARPTGRYMTEKVNKAYFVNSEVVDGHLHAVEDLYARYFERGSHKSAVNRLRAKIGRAGDYTGNVFRNGMFLAIGMVFGIEGIVYGHELLYTPDAMTNVHTSYLLQVCALVQYCTPD